MSRLPQHQVGSGGYPQELFDTMPFPNMTTRFIPRASTGDEFSRSVLWLVYHDIFGFCRIDDGPLDDIAG